MYSTYYPTRALPIKIGLGPALSTLLIKVSIKKGINETSTISKIKVTINITPQTNFNRYH